MLHSTAKKKASGIDTGQSFIRTHHKVKFPSNELASEKSSFMLVTDDVFQLDKLSPVKLVACRNMPCMLVTLETSHVSRP